MIRTVNSQWQQSGLSGIDTRALAVASNGLIYAATANGYVYKSTNNGNSWFVSSPLLYNAEDMEIKSNGYIFLANLNGIYRSTNEGSSWQLIYGPTTDVKCVEILPNGNIIIGTVAQGPRISTNNGTTWTLSNNGLNQTVISLAVDKTNGDIYAGTYYSGVFKSSNGGSSWDRSLFLDEYVLGISINGNGDIYAGVTADGRIFKSSNNGSSWQQVLTAGSNLTAVYTLQPLPTGEILAGTNNIGIYKTSNNGINWTPFNDGLSSLGIFDFSLDSLNFVYGATGSDGIYKRPLNSDITINLTMFIEGFFNPQTNTQVADTVKAYLRAAFSPYDIIDSSKTIVGANGTGTLRFLSAPTGTYYLLIKHRNTIETWSSTGGIALIRGQTTSYDFTNLITQAYGSNMVLKGSKYCFYSGDVNQDGVIDISDLSLIYNASNISLGGHVPEDLDGDNFVDIADLSIDYNNVHNSIAVISPLTSP